MSLEIQKFFYVASVVETRLGFDDDELLHKANEISIVREHIEIVQSMGFHFVGDTQESNSASKAYTDPVKKWIFIGRKKTTEEALLSLTYELTNAKNGQILTNIYDKYVGDILPDSTRAAEYAKEVMHVEASAVYTRSRVAIKVGTESLVKNKKYLEIVKGAGHR
jgi:hypothetical protein